MLSKGISKPSKSTPQCCGTLALSAPAGVNVLSRSSNAAGFSSNGNVFGFVGQNSKTSTIPDIDADRVDERIQHAATEESPVLRTYGTWQLHMQPGEQTFHPASEQNQSINPKAALFHDGSLAVASVRSLLGMQNSALSAETRLLHHAEHIPEGLSTMGSHYHCATQRCVEGDANGYTRARVGYGGFAGRWERGSVLRYNIDKGSFGDQDLADLTEREAIKAISMWSNPGVRFEKVGSSEKATFQIQYRYLPRDRDRTAYADFFLPGTEPSILYVYERALDESNKPHLAKILAHEIGHILGLRHEFAGDREAGSMLWGEPNPMSVMNYFSDAAAWSSVQEQDIRKLRDFYGLPENFEMVNGLLKMKVRSIAPDYFLF